jgi:hypothetical protein
VKNLLLHILVIFSIPALADVPAAQKGEVDHLLKFVEQSDCIMIRNGTEHDGKEALSHIQVKYDYFRNNIKSTEDFIKFSASKSTMSGRYYTVKCPGKEEMKSRDWLLNELESFRQKSGLSE